MNIEEREQISLNQLVGTFSYVGQPALMPMTLDRSGQLASIAPEFHLIVEPLDFLSNVPRRELPESTDQRFRRLADKWRQETKLLSSPDQITSHPAYQEILLMGIVVIPLMLQELLHGSSSWFHALRLLTGHNPVKPEDAGKVAKMHDAWVRWARDNGLL